MNPSGEERNELVDRDDVNITVKKQCELLDVNRTGIYREEWTREPDAKELLIRNLIDYLHTDEPTWGYRKMTDWLNLYMEESLNHKRIYRIMREMGVYAIYPAPNLSKRFHAKYVKPYLLRKMKISRPNQVWGVDITYIPMEKGFMYLFVIIDWCSRYIVDYELSSTLDKAFVIKCMRRALKRNKPEIVNSDQGCQFTNPDYIRLLEENGVRISMDGKGQCLDNARTERFFRTLKYDRIYVYEIRSPRELRKILKKYFGLQQQKTT